MTARAPKRDNGRRPAWVAAVRSWLTCDPHASAQSIRDMLHDFDIDVPLRTVSHHLKSLRPKRGARVRPRSPRTRDAVTVNRAFAASKLKALGVPQAGAEAMAALAGVSFASPSEEKDAIAKLAQARTARELPARIEYLSDDADDASNRQLGEELTRSLGRVQIASRRVGAPTDGPKHSIDRSKPCRLVHQEIKGAHRHCVACGRDWDERAVGVSPLRVSISTSREDGSARTRLGYRYAVRRGRGYVWTDAPKASDAFVWACVPCWHAAASALPPSRDRDALLQELSPTSPDWLRSVDADPILQRLRRRFPTLWPWQGGPSEAADGRRVLVVVIGFKPLTVGTTSVQGGAAALIGFARHASVAHFFHTLVHVQRCVGALARRAAKSRRIPPVALPLTLPALPSLGVRKLELLVEIDSRSAKSA